jgi:serine phosphatase RsbU (regulator of sigma subunit)
MDRSVLGLIPDLPVLVVHEDDSYRGRLQEMLIRWQTNPTCVASGEEMRHALEKSRNVGTPIGLLIVSNLLRGESGSRLCWELQKSQLHSAVPRILLVSEDESRTSAVMLGAATLLSTPVDSSELAKAILSSVLGKGRFRQMRNGIGAAEMYVRSLIPMPTTEPIRIDWRYVPAADLAGDALGFQWIDDDHCALYVIDVCGHGLDASLLSVTILNVLKSMSLPATDFRRPNQVLAELNRKFPMERHGDRGFTAWYGVYVRSAGELRWSAGGHPPALLFSSQNANDPVKRLDSLGPMIGMLSDSEFDCQSCAVANGDRLLIYSDGVFEFETPEGRFGTLEEFIAFARDRAESPKLLDHLWHRAHQISGSQTLDDDFTILDATF